MILVVDNYDSFTYNLVDLVLRTGTPTRVVRNDEMTADEALALNPRGILISPGPGRPEDSNLSLKIVQKSLGKIPILGICLGHQLLGMLAGMEVQLAEKPMHGKTSYIHHRGESVFEGMPNPFQAMRYHSLLLGPSQTPADIDITAWTADGEIMGIHHKILNFAGVQFHPESILTEEGNRILRNWLSAL